MRTAIFNKNRLIVALLATVGLLVLTHIPQKHMQNDLDMFGFDKVLHFFAYAVLTGLMIIALNPPRGFIAKLGVLIALLFLSIADEYTQAFVGRARSSMDLAADMIGMLVVMALSVSWPQRGAAQKSRS